MQNTTRISRKQARASLELYRPQAGTLSGEDAALMLGILDALCHRYRNGDPPTDKAIEAVYRLAQAIVDRPATYLPALFAGIDQAKFDQERD